MARTIIFTNGQVPDLEAARKLIRAGDVICAADGGTRHALALGFRPSIVIGDLDSLRREDRQYLEDGGAEIRQYPTDKDQTDLELAITYVLENGDDAILIIGGLGGRLDQILGNLFLLSDPRMANRDIRLDDGVEETFFVRNQARIQGKPGDILSLIPWEGPAMGVRTLGLRWPLTGENLSPERTRGISNELLSESAFVSLQSGILLVVHARRKITS